VLPEDVLRRIVADHREAWRAVKAHEEREIGLTEERREAPRVHVPCRAEGVEHAVEVVHHPEAVHAIAHPLRLVDPDVEGLLHLVAVHLAPHRPCVRHIEMILDISMMVHRRFPPGRGSWVGPHCDCPSPPGVGA
jgi:hypothetical protein